MQLNDYQKEIIDAYKACVNRYRWFLLTTIFISCLLLVIMFLENLSIARAQNVNAIAERLARVGAALNAKAVMPTTTPVAPGAVAVSTVALITTPTRDQFSLIYKDENLPMNGVGNAYESVTLLMEVKDPDTRKMPDNKKRALLAIAEGVYEEALAKQTMDDLKIAPETLPFLGLNVPHNDYAVVLMLMLLVFSTGVWLNLRSVYAAVMEIKAQTTEQANLLKLARLSFVFTGLHPTSSIKFHRIVKYVAFFLPFASALTVLVVDCGLTCYNTWSNGAYFGMHLGKYMFWRVAIFIVLTAFIGLFGWQIFDLDKKVDEIVIPPDLKPSI